MYTFKYSNLFVMYFQLHLYWHKMFFFFSIFKVFSPVENIDTTKDNFGLTRKNTFTECKSFFFLFLRNSVNRLMHHIYIKPLLRCWTLSPPSTIIVPNLSLSLSLSLSLNNFDFLFKWIKINLPKRNKFWDYSCLQYACTYIWYCYLLAKLLFWKYMNICVFP